MGTSSLGLPRMTRRLRNPHRTEIGKFLIFRILISVMSRLCQIHNEKTGYYLWSPYTAIRPESVGGLAPAGNFEHGASGSEAGGVGCRKTVTAAGEGDTESATRSCKLYSVAPTGMRHFRSCNQDGGHKRRQADLR